MYNLYLCVCICVYPGFLGGYGVTKELDMTQRLNNVCIYTHTYICIQINLVFHSPIVPTWLPGQISRYRNPNIHKFADLSWKHMLLLKCWESTEKPEGNTWTNFPGFTKVALLCLTLCYTFWPFKKFSFNRLQTTFCQTVFVFKTLVGFKINVDQMFSIYLHLTDHSGILPEQQDIPRDFFFFFLFSDTNVCDGYKALDSRVHFFVTSISQMLRKFLFSVTG